MANIKSQIKRNRQNDKARQRNRIHRGEARTAVKQARTSIEAGAVEESKETVLKAIVTLDKAVQKGVLHKNNAARRKSRLVKQLATMKPAEPKAVKAEPVMEAAVEEAPKKAPARRRTVKAEAEAAPAAAAPAKKPATPRKKPAAPKAK